MFTLFQKSTTITVLIVIEVLRTSNDFSLQWRVRRWVSRSPHSTLRHVVLSSPAWARTSSIEKQLRVRGCERVTTDDREQSEHRQLMTAPSLTAPCVVARASSGVSQYYLRTVYEFTRALVLWHFSVSLLEHLVS